MLWLFFLFLIDIEDNIEIESDFPINEDSKCVVRVMSETFDEFSDVEEGVIFALSFYNEVEPVRIIQNRVEYGAMRDSYQKLEEIYDELLEIDEVSVAKEMACIEMKMDNIRYEMHKFLRKEKIIK
jgi:glutathionyl-hydroquinone reductase